MGKGPAIPACEAKVLAAMAEGKSPVEAVAEAGYTVTEQNARTIANALWNRHVNANGSVMEALSRVGVDPAFVAGKFRKLLDAKNTIISKHGMFEVDDNTSQLKALDMIMKTTGAYAAKTSISAGFTFESALFDLDDDD